MKQISILFICICFLFACNKESVDPNSELSLLKSQTWVLQKMEKYNTEIKQYEPYQFNAFFSVNFSSNITTNNGENTATLPYEYEPGLLRAYTTTEKKESSKIVSYIKKVDREELILEGKFFPYYLLADYRYTYIAQK